MTGKREEEQSWSTEIRAELIALEDILSGGSNDTTALESVLPRLQSLIEKMEQVANGNTSR